MAAGNARYAQADGIWFFKLAGDLRHTLAPALNAVLDQAFAAPDTAGFVIDLSEAENIDSTCLGILARIGKRTQATRPVIVTAGEDIREVLLAVCFDRIFDLVDHSGPGDATLQDLPGASADMAAMRQLVLDAHRRLCDLDERNHKAFRDVIEALEGDDDSASPR